MKQLKASADFETARIQAFLRDAGATLRGDSRPLLSFDEVRRAARFDGQFYRGLKDIAIADIRGSVGRPNDFDASFLPVRPQMRQRWAQLDAAMRRGEAVPPIEVYHLGDVYFVKDGHHRVSVARHLHWKTIPARVIEVRTRAPLARDMDAAALLTAREYVDFLLGSGPMLVGHAHPEVTEAAQAQIARGTTFFANNRLGIELAEAIVDAVPCAEQVRFVSSGSEADLYAMRAARAFTRKDKILKFEGGYHGMSDYSLMSLAPKRSGNFPAAVPDSAGIPKSVRDDMLIAPFNDAEAVADLVHEHKGELAGVIVEPFQRIIPPAPGFLAALRKITADNGIPLIFDEVVTGFRLAYGGATEK